MHGSSALAAWRKNEKRSQTECAEKVGVRQATWSEWEAGKKNPQIAHAIKIEQLTDGAVPVSSWIQPANDDAPPESGRRPATDDVAPPADDHHSDPGPA